MKFINPRVFVKYFVMTSILFMFFIILANIIVDPFYRFNIITNPRINLQRYQFSSNVRMGKAGAVCRSNPGTIIMGSSRAEVGLSPYHPSFRYQPVYNMAMAGTGIKELRDNLRHAIIAAPNLKQVVIAIDFFMFNAYREAVLFNTEVFDYDPNRLLSKPNDLCLKNFFYDLNRLIGFTGLYYVFQTIRSQRGEYSSDLVKDDAEAHWWTALYDANGFRGKSYYALRDIAEKKGIISFYEVDTHSQEYYYASRIWRASTLHRYCFVTPGQQDTFDIFKDIVNLLREHHINAIFIINPIHARMMVTIQNIGLWPQYEDWKRNLVKILSEDSRNRNSLPYTLWDFSEFNSVTMSNPPKNNHLRLISRWFWEPSHYREEAGNIILSKVLDPLNASNIPPVDFGIVLNENNIEDELTKNLRMSRIYMGTHRKSMKILNKRLSELDHNWEGSSCGEDMRLLWKGSAAYQQGNIMLAKTMYEQAHKLHEADRARFKKLSVPYRELAFEQAYIDVLRGKTIDEPLNSWEAYQNRGVLRVSQRDFAGAIRDYTKAIEMTTTNAALYFLRGQARLNINDYGNAKRDFLAGLNLEPKNPELKQLLALASSHIKKSSG